MNPEIEEKKPDFKVKKADKLIVAKKTDPQKLAMALFGQLVNFNVPISIECVGEDTLKIAILSCYTCNGFLARRGDKLILEIESFSLENQKITNNAGKEELIDPRIGYKILATRVKKKNE